jgi:hypothetical protein
MRPRIAVSIFVGGKSTPVGYAPFASRRAAD